VTNRLTGAVGISTSSIGSINRLVELIPEPYMERFHFSALVDVILYHVRGTGNAAY